MAVILVLKKQNRFSFFWVSFANISAFLAYAFFFLRSQKASKHLPWERPTAEFLRALGVYKTRRIFLDSSIVVNKCKSFSGCSMCVFKQDHFTEVLRDAVVQGFDAVYALTQMCSARISFAKGWGEDYRRQSVTEMPCWIDVYFNGPMQWVDSVLKQMDGPTCKCSSFT